MKKHLPFFVLLAVLLSSCITLRIETKIKANGSGTKSFVMAIDKSAMSMIESMAQESGETDLNTDDIWETARMSAEAIKGARVEDYHDDKSEGIKVSVPFKNFAELQALSGSDAFEGADAVTVTEQDDQVTLTAVVDTSDIVSGLSAAGGQDLGDFDLGEIDFEYSYIIDVEGKILSYGPKNMAEVKGGKVTWDLTQATTDSVELTVTWEPGGGGLDTTTILLIVVAAAGILLVVAGVMISVRGRRAAGGERP